MNHQIALSVLHDTLFACTWEESGKMWALSEIESWKDRNKEMSWDDAPFWTLGTYLGTLPTDDPCCEFDRDSEYGQLLDESWAFLVDRVAAKVWNQHGHDFEGRVGVLYVAIDTVNDVVLHVGSLNSCEEAVRGTCTEAGENNSAYSDENAFLIAAIQGLSEKHLAIVESVCVPIEITNLRESVVEYLTKVDRNTGRIYLRMSSTGKFSVDVGTNFGLSVAEFNRGTGDELTIKHQLAYDAHELSDDWHLADEGIETVAEFTKSVLEEIKRYGVDFYLKR